jgi:aminomethyltransferase
MSNQMKKTPVNNWHHAHHAKLVEFGGWEMPVEFGGIIQEHLAVRSSAGLFDICHMGELMVEGPEALSLLQWVTPNDASRLKIGQIHYSALLTPQGTFVDDLLIYRMAEQRFFICTNAANTEKDFAWIQSHNHFHAQVFNRSEDFAQLALQGPRSLDILQPLVDIDLASLHYYWFKNGKLGDSPVLISRTGYTGEDGFEIYLAPEKAESLWCQLLEAGQSAGLIPVGLGARNTLRLEARMALYGHEISDQITPWEAGLDWIVKMNKGAFIGREALENQPQSAIRKKLVGFEMISKGIARDNYPVLHGGTECGWVTSGSPSPTLHKNIGLAYLPASIAQPGQEFEIQIRANRVPARIVDTPFYRKK